MREMRDAFPPAWKTHTTARKSRTRPSGPRGALARETKTLLVQHPRLKPSPGRGATGRRQARRCRTGAEVPVTRPGTNPSAGRRIPAASAWVASRASSAVKLGRWSRARKPSLPRCDPQPPPTRGPPRLTLSEIGRRRSTPCSGSTPRRRGHAAASRDSSSPARSPWIDTTRRTRTTCRAWRPQMRSPRTSGQDWSVVARPGRSSSAKPAPSPTSRTRYGNWAPTWTECARCSRRRRTCCWRRRSPSVP